MASNRAEVVWQTAPASLAVAARRWSENLWLAMQRLAAELAARFEQKMVTEANWSDQSGLARSSLRAWADATDRTITITLQFLIKSAMYHLFLEFGTKYWEPTDRYSIVRPTFAHALTETQKAMQGLMR